MSTDLSDKSNEFRHGYLTCVEDMREWFLSEQSHFANERKRLKRQLEQQKVNFKRRHHNMNGYRAGVRAVLLLPLRQIADLKRQLKMTSDLSPVVKTVRAEARQRLEAMAVDGANENQGFDDALREAMATRTAQEESTP